MWYLKPCFLLLLLLRRQQWWKETPPPSAPRIIADPAFLCKLLLEQAAIIGCSVYLELKNHKDSLQCCSCLVSCSLSIIW